MNAIKQIQRPAGDVDSELAATVYAEALLNVAQEQKRGEEVLRALQTLLDEVVRKNPDISEFFQSAAIGRERKAEVLQRVFSPERVDPVLAQFLLVLNEHDRLNLLSSISVVAERLFLRRNNQLLVDVVSAVSLTEAEQERLKTMIRGITNAEPIPTFRLDPELLGGFVLRAGSWLFDGSVRGRLQSMRETLFERKP